MPSNGRTRGTVGAGKTRGRAVCRYLGALSIPTSKDANLAEKRLGAPLGTTFYSADYRIDLRRDSTSKEFQRSYQTVQVGAISTFVVRIIFIKEGGRHGSQTLPHSTDVYRLAHANHISSMLFDVLIRPDGHVKLHMPSPGFRVVPSKSKKGMPKPRAGSSKLNAFGSRVV